MRLHGRGVAVSHPIMCTLVLGLGNSILTDDGVGIHVIREVAARSHPDGITFAEASVGGLRLLETIEGYHRLILADAIRTPSGIPGEIHRLLVTDVRASMHAGSTHDLSFRGALAFGRRLGMALPDDKHIVIVAIEAEDVLTFGEVPTPAVAASIPQAVKAVLCELEMEGAR